MRMPSQDSRTADKAGAPEGLSLPTGIGLSIGPTAFLVGTTLDFPVDKQLTLGPSLQYGADDQVDLLSATGQVKYFLPVVGAEGSRFSMQPFLTAGAGVVRIDKEGRPGDSGLSVNAGLGVRFLSGDHYRIGTELRLHVMPDEVAGEDTFLSLEVLQVVISF